MTFQEQGYIFNEWLDKYKALIFKIVHAYGNTPMDREDLFQEITIQVWRSIPTFRHESAVPTWIYRIALNTAISDLRRQKKNITLTEPAQLPTEIEDIQYYKEKEEQLQQLHTAIDQLTEIEKAITMLYLEDKSYDEMEDILGINQNNLRVKMNRIKEKLRKLTKAVEHGIG